MIPPQTNPADANQTALAEARLRAQRLAADFEAVFGQEKRRSLAQRSVLGHLAACAGDDANSYRFNEAKDGVALIAAGLHRDGAKSLLRIIDRQLSIAANAAKPKPEKPKVKR